MDKTTNKAMAGLTSHIPRAPLLSKKKVVFPSSAVSFSPTPSVIPTLVTVNPWSSNPFSTNQISIYRSSIQLQNIVCAVLVLFMTEEEAYWTISTICEDLLPDYYGSSMAGSSADQRVFEILIRKHLHYQ